MKLSQLLHGGVVTVNEDIDFSSPLESQIWSLNENISNIKYDSGLLLDIGWTNEFDTDGFFQINLIREGDWENPIYRRNVTFEDLPRELTKLLNQITKPPS